MSGTVYSQTPYRIQEDFNIKRHIQEYGHQQMIRGFTVYMIFVFDFLNAENNITLIERQRHKHHKQANVTHKCTLLPAG
jgi:hypothetical protein